MNLLGLILLMVLVGVAVWALTTYIPMDPAIKNVIRIVAVVAVVIIALNAFGVFNAISGVNVPRIEK